MVPERPMDARWAALIVMTLTVLPTGAQAGETYWQCDPASPGLWAEELNWTDGVPTADDHAEIDNGGTAVVVPQQVDALELLVGNANSGSVQQFGGTASIGSLVLAAGVGSAGQYGLNYTGGPTALLAGSQTIGQSGAGTFSNAGAVNTVTGDLELGVLAGSSGVYGLTVGGQVSAANTYVGRGGSGEFNHVDGTHTLTGDLYIGHSAGSQGIYTFYAGSVSGTALHVGHEGAGILNWTGGSLNFAALNVGHNGPGQVNWSGGSLAVAAVSLGPQGSMNFMESWDGGWNLDISGGAADFNGHSILVDGPVSPTMSGGSLTAQTLTVGKTGGATFNPTGGTIVLQSGLTVGQEAGSEGAYHMADTTLWYGSDHAQVVVGRRGTGTFTQHSGWHAWIDRLYVGREQGSDGTYELGNGYLSAENAYVGYEGTGRFRHTAAGLQMVNDSLYIGYGTGSSGSYELTGDGELRAGMIIVGSGGDGTFTQTGGLVEARTSVALGASLDSLGQYRLEGGELSTSGLYLGGDGEGRFIQTGGTATVGHLEIAPGSRYELGGGVLEISGCGLI